MGTGTSAVAVFVDVGSRDETMSQWGAAHFLEHMAFKGSGPYDAGEIAARSDRLGGEVNAFTTREYTCFYAKVLDGLVPQAFELLDTLVSDPWLKASDMQRERMVIREERREAEDDLDDRVEEAYLGTAFPDPSFSHEILGTDATLAAMTTESLRAFHRQWYAPRRRVIALSGQGARNLGKNLLARWGAAGSGEVSGRPVPDFSPGTIRVSAPGEQIHVMLGVKAPGLTDPAFFPAGMAASILGGQNTSRLWQRLREREALTYSVHCSYSAYPGFGDMAVNVVLHPDQYDRAMAVLFEEIDRLADGGVTSDEVEWARIQMESGLRFALETAEGRMLRVGRFGLLGLTPIDPERVAQLLADITPETVSSWARTLWGDRARMAYAAAGAVSETSAFPV